ncbi:hypothetical protein FUT69_09510 [Xylella taiwanensis]|uniref:Class IIb bacteriocin, lactobin A/cerein 7B family n=1 Tax=Xylella taiwanensis TaxID=1444770 RepID=A0ABS8TWG4_9GAMM|nr:hypothetical protein [Xylella taiwanensis]MCD8456062.1 hypothetical protein [Xylella taiwanensis]MCD8458466.1 hypothetical protein [Xylella taiwanensis]MCD8460602.1 hypothetical protein [Xylella taiwanensis]MCD8463336.1 hypothetical protein [Xylella taiwanensis]MCD8465107.1 hypothetical protein [Xylella taiwanensis]
MRELSFQEIENVEDGCCGIIIGCAIGGAVVVGAAVVTTVAIRVIALYWNWGNVAFNLQPCASNNGCSQNVVKYECK